MQVVLLGFHATSEEALLGNYYGVPRGGVTSFEAAFQVPAQSLIVVHLQRRRGACRVPGSLSIQSTTSCAAGRVELRCMGAELPFADLHGRLHTG